MSVLDRSAPRRDPGGTGAEPSPERHRWLVVAEWVALTDGIGLRAVRWAASPSLWYDEAAVSVNIVERSFAGLTHPLVFDQGAPVGWLWMQRLAVDVFGEGERVLRLWPMLAGIATLFAVRALARRLYDGAGVLVAVTAAALWTPLVHYTGEAKQYSTDALVGTLAVVMALRVLQGARRSRLQFAVAANAFVWISHPGAIAVGGALAAIGLVDLWGRDRRRLAGDVATGASLVVSLGILWWLTLSDLAGSSVAGGFNTSSTSSAPSAGEAAWTLLSDIATVPGAAPGPGQLAILALIAIGALGLLARRSVVLVVIAGIGVLALAADRFGPYPILPGRLSQYLVPLALVLAAGAVDAARQLATHIEQRRPLASRQGIEVARLARALPGITLVAMMMTVVLSLNGFSPRTIEQARPLAQDLIDRYDDEPVYVYLSTGPAYRFYDRGLDLPPVEAAVRLRRTVRPEAQRLATQDWGCTGDVRFGSEAVWLVTTHIDPGLDGDFHDQTDILASLGEVKERIEYPVAAALRMVPGPQAERELCRLDPGKEGIQPLQR